LDTEVIVARIREAHGAGHVTADEDCQDLRRLSVILENWLPIFQFTPAADAWDDLIQVFDTVITEVENITE
jgi:hypothetical protein